MPRLEASFARDFSGPNVSVVIRSRRKLRTWLYIFESLSRNGTVRKVFLGVKLLVFETALEHT